MTTTKLLAIALFLLCPWIAHGETSASAPYIQVELVSEYRQLKPNNVNWIGIHFIPESGWHTYWLNPGDSGEPPKIDWQSDMPGSFGDIQWPTPEAIPVAHLVNYGYEGNNLLMVPFTFEQPPALNSPVEITASVSWLVCKEDCIPGWADLSITLTVGEDVAPSQHAELFESTRKILPFNDLLFADYEVTESHISVSLNKSLTKASFNSAILFPFRSDVIQHNQQQSQIETQSNQIFVLPRSNYFIEDKSTLKFLVKVPETSFYLTANPNTNSTNNETHNDMAILGLFLMAFLGGMILNVMPCVLPVLSLKAISITRGSQEHSRWGYLCGVLISFYLFAVIILLIKQSGELVGWGFHMQEPAVIAFLAFLFVFISLLLMDLIPNQGRFAGIGQSMVEGQGFISQFFTGVLAVVVASPCTAPFMAAAMGVALVSEPLITFLLFTGLALGFAFPLTLVFTTPKALAWIPKPGLWMNHFKQFLIFPMLATVIWLLWVYAGQVGTSALILLLSSLLLFSFLFWLSSFTKPLLSIVAVAGAILLLVISLTHTGTQSTDKEASPEIGQPFSSALLESLKQDNKIVLVNMTADWCITCKVNEQVAFNTDQFTQLIEQDEVEYLVGDWTNKNDSIFNYLKQYQRSGVPLYVVYAGTQSKQVLPQILTTNIIIDAIQQAKEDMQQ